MASQEVNRSLNPKFDSKPSQSRGFFRAPILKSVKPAWTLFTAEKVYGPANSADEAKKQTKGGDFYWRNRFD
jgi:hypothetical protein